MEPTYLKYLMNINHYDEDDNDNVPWFSSKVWSQQLTPQTRKSIWFWWRQEGKSCPYPWLGPLPRAQFTPSTQACSWYQTTDLKCLLLSLWCHTGLYSKASIHFSYCPCSCIKLRQAAMLSVHYLIFHCPYQWSLWSLSLSTYCVFRANWAIPIDLYIY